MTAEQQAKDFIEKNGGSGLWIVGAVAVLACAAGTGAWCCYKKGCFGDQKEGGENESRSIFKTSIKSKNIHKRETKENLVPASSVHPEEEI